MRQVLGYQIEYAMLMYPTPLPASPMDWTVELMRQALG